MAKDSGFQQNDIEQEVVSQMGTCTIQCKTTEASALIGLIKPSAALCKCLLPNLQVALKARGPRAPEVREARLLSNSMANGDAPSMFNCIAYPRGFSTSQLEHSNVKLEKRPYR